VQRFAEHLRSAGLTVVTDVDVKSPVGPPEGWPRWMRNKIAEADWVLLYIDETYRRRYDGNEEPGKGLGATWEGCIITNELYQAATSNSKFIPLLSDGEDSGLIPPELVGATRYFIPSQQNDLAQSILAFEADPESSATSVAVTGATGSDLTSPSMDEWRRGTVERFVEVFLTLRSEDRKAKVADSVGFAPSADRDPLCKYLDGFIRRYSDDDTFDMESIALLVAEFDALRTDAAGHSEDLAVLTELQDLLLPLCIHPGIKAEVARQMEQHGSAIIDEAVALVIGAELAAAPADVRQARFRLDDDGMIAGEGLLRFVDAAIGDPKPEQLVSEILHDLADQLGVSLDEEIEDQPDVRKRIDAWTDGLKLQVRAHRKRKKRRFYCVVKPPKNATLRKTLVDLLARVRLDLPEIVFFQLHRRSRTKAAEEVVMQILKDRFTKEGQQ
jgi:hypothetical protein